MKKKVLLCILDGWGIGRKNKNNAIHIAKTKNFDTLKKNPIIISKFNKNEKKSFIMYFRRMGNWEKK